MQRLTNKSAIVTGAASGLGLAITNLFLEHGARVLATDYNAEKLAALAAKHAGNNNLHTLVADVANAEHTALTISTALAAFGSISILVNNAGVMDDFSPVGSLTDELWQRVMSINVDGPMRLMRAVIPTMLAAHAGSIINIASIGGLNGARAGAAYTTSKHALIGLSKNTGYLYAKDGIRCNAIAAGAMDTDIASTIDFAHLPEPQMFNERIAPGMALNPRSSNPLEVAQLALFLASDEASFVNGATLTADGGWTAY